MSVPDPLAALARGFVVEDKRPEREYHVVTCKVCKARWSLGSASPRVGSILKLLDHAASHEVQS